MPQHSDDVIAQRRANVARLYLQGWRQSDIAIQEGVTQGQISQDLESIRKEWTDSTLFDFNEAKIQELKKIDNLEATLWQAWYDSMKPLKKKSTKAYAKAESDEAEKDVKPSEVTETTEERLGDPRYLMGIDRCIDKRIKILGLEAPLKITQTDTEGKNLKAAQTIYIVDTTNGKLSPDPDEDYNYSSK